MVKKQQGLSLIELIIFIVILGVVSSSLLIGLNQAISNSDLPRDLPEASFLANARLQIILMNRANTGYSSLSDPCTTTPSLDICTPLATYASTYGFTVATQVISGSNPKTITVNVTGPASAIATQDIYNYANN